MLVEILMGDFNYISHKQTESILFEVEIPGTVDKKEFNQLFNAGIQKTHQDTGIPRPQDLFKGPEEDLIECSSKEEAEILLNQLNSIYPAFLIDDYPPRRGPKVFIEVSDSDLLALFAMAYAARSIPDMHWKRIFPIQVCSGLGFGLFKAD